MQDVSMFEKLHKGDGLLLLVRVLCRSWIRNRRRCRSCGTGLRLKLCEGSFLSENGFTECFDIGIQSSTINIGKGSDEGGELG